STRDSGLGTRDFVGPRDDLERRLVEVWSAVLGVHPLGIAESFFELGGTSLRAVQLFARIKDVFGVDLPLETLFKAPTVMECAALLAQALGLSRDLSVPGAPAVGGAWSPLVAIRAGGAPAPVEPANGGGVRGGSPAPFFCVHGAGGHVLNFYDLAHRLGPDQPFYGLQARGVDGTLVPLGRIEEMAALYLEEIRRVQPAGPYFLGGYSGGGVIAFEMAQQLRRAGQEIALLVLIDSASPRLPTRHALSANWRGLCRLGPGYARHLPRKALEGVLRHLRRLQIEHYRRRGQPLPHTLRDLAIWDATLQALRTYAPQPYAGAAVLFRSAVIDPAYGHHEADLGWTELVQGGLTLEIVPGDHQSLMAEPNAAVLADALRARLRAALR
ncbi:MAG TPA: thioesterase domain-containing protein, partial [Chloroflexota bacterium]|nr:thioesterase domain-containing protein [Chloroflexota bacterium]